MRDEISGHKFDRALFEHNHRAQNRHFWFVARNRIIAALCRHLAKDGGAGFRALEAGCGTGNVVRCFERCWPNAFVMGMDLFPEALAYARQHTSAHLLQADIHNAPFEESLDLVGMFDVVEHLADDVEVLRRVARILKPGGRVVLTVPAHPSLWSYCDEANRHFRRYTRHGLQEKLEQAGFQIEYASHFMSLLSPPIWAKRKLFSRPSGKLGHQTSVKTLLRDLRIIPLVNGLLTWLASQEAHLVRNRLRLPFGTSLIAVARKPNGAA